jgi:hypothetical protein
MKVIILFINLLLVLTGCKEKPFEPQDEGKLLGLLMKNLLGLFPKTEILFIKTDDYSPFLH